MSWADRVDELLYDGETVREEVAIGPNRVFVTSHRLLAFTPDDGGRNYRAVDRPNVDGVSATDESDPLMLAKAVSWGLVGTFLFAFGVLFEAGSLFSTPEGLEEGAAGGAGDLVSLFDTILTALALADEAVAVLGVLLGLLAAYDGWRYADSRERVVSIDVAGDDAIRLVADEVEAETVAATLRDALQAPQAEPTAPTA